MLTLQVIRRELQGEVVLLTLAQPDGGQGPADACLPQRRGEAALAGGEQLSLLGQSLRRGNQPFGQHVNVLRASFKGSIGKPVQRPAQIGALLHEGAAMWRGEFGCGRWWFAVDWSRSQRR